MSKKSVATILQAHFLIIILRKIKPGTSAASDVEVITEKN